MTTEIPKRPEMGQYYYEEETDFLDGLIDHEHSVAKVAVEALKNIGEGRIHSLADLAIAGRWHDFTDVLQREAREALAKIEVSGWKP